MRIDKVYKIDGKIIEFGMILKVFYDFESTKQGRFISISGESIKLDCSDRYMSSIVEINVNEIEEIKIVED